MTAKTFEVRDKDTFIPALAIKLEPGNEQDRYLISKAGYGKKEKTQSDRVLFGKLNDPELHFDPFSWNGRTMFTAHRYVKEHFNELESGAVVDVEFILGETSKPKESEH